MDLKRFYAYSSVAPLYEGEVEGNDVYREVKLERYAGSNIPLPSGSVGISDPFVLKHEFARFAVPKTWGKVFVTTVVDKASPSISADGREAYFSLLFSDEEPYDVFPATPLNLDPYEDGIYGVPVDAGNVSFFDSDLMAENLSSESALRKLEARMETIASLGSIAPLVYYNDTSEEYFVFSGSGWGDGVYPVYKTVNAQGEMLGIHIDLLVVGELEEDDE